MPINVLISEELYVLSFSQVSPNGITAGERHRPNGNGLAMQDPGLGKLYRVGL